MATDLKFENGFLEAPASWNTRYVTQEGFVCQITLRGDTGRDLLEKANVALSFLKDQGYLPCDNNNNHHSNGDTKLCPIHHCEMKKREKDGKAWYSHKTDEGWCYGKQRRNGGNHEQ
jgi:hypothetical protein